MTITNSLRDLHPIALPPFVRLQYRLQDAFDSGRIKQLFLPFETYRTPERQNELLRNGQGVTRAGAWQSAHQFGLAVDFVPFLMKSGSRNGWDWGHDNQWGDMRAMAKAEGLLTPYDWDLAHVVHPVWRKMQKVMNDEPKPAPLPPSTVVK